MTASVVQWSEFLADKLSIGLWRWYINITITDLHTINHPVLYIKTRRFGDWVLSTSSGWFQLCVLTCKYLDVSGFEESLGEMMKSLSFKASLSKYMQALLYKTEYVYLLIALLIHREILHPPLPFLEILYFTTRLNRREAREGKINFIHHSLSSIFLGPKGISVISYLMIHFAFCSNAFYKKSHFRY
jgi:hypothetical protein